MTSVCYYLNAVCIRYNLKIKDTADNACAYVSARSIRNSLERAFLDVRVYHAQALPMPGYWKWIKEFSRHYCIQDTLSSRARLAFRPSASRTQHLLRWERRRKPYLQSKKFVAKWPKSRPCTRATIGYLLYARFLCSRAHSA